MAEHRGYATIVDPDAPLLERDTCCCGHCQRVIFLAPGAGITRYLIRQPSGEIKEEAGAFCRCCMRPVCLRCHAVGSCRPFEQLIEKLEA
jgi:hypothetical protein